jgi:FkbM family methyltransferase
MSSPEPAISVVMPVYNGAAYLERAVASVRRQSFPHWELLAVDDRSFDDSHGLLCRLAAGEPRLRVFQTLVNGGPSAARNVALRQARCGWIAYLDCDDEFYPDHLQRVHDSRERGDVLVFGYDLREERPGSPGFGQVRAYDPSPYHSLLMRQHIVVPLGVAHRRDLLDRSGLFEESLRRDEDSDLWRRFAQAGAAFTFLPAKSGLYHVRPDSQSRTQPPANVGLPSPPALVEVSTGGQRHYLRIAREEAWLVREVFERHEYGGLPRGLLRTPPLILDVGANVGAFALYAKLFYHRDAVIHCFEPFPPNVALLRENVSPLGGVHVHAVALGDADGERTLHLHRNNSGANSLMPGLIAAPAGRTAVPVRDAGRVWDDLRLEEVDLLKIDTEGCEVEILRSLGPRLRSVRVVLAEFHTGRDRRGIDAALPDHELFGIKFHEVRRGVVRYARGDLLPRG